MKRTLINLLLIVVFCACFFFAMTTDGMAALIPIFIAICVAIGGVKYNTDFIKRY